MERIWRAASPVSRSLSARHATPDARAGMGVSARARAAAPHAAAAAGRRVRSDVELVGRGGVETREEAVERFLEALDVARTDAPPAARLLELLLVPAEVFEVLPEFRAHEAGVLLEILLLCDHVARGLEDPPLLLPVEELELLLHGDVRGEDRLHDVRAVERRAEAVLERPDVLEGLLPREVLEPLAGLEVPPQEVEKRDHGLDLGRADRRPVREAEERLAEPAQLVRRAEHRVAVRVLRRPEAREEEVDLVHLVGAESGRVVVELQDRKEELLVAGLDALEELPERARRDQAVVVGERPVQAVQLAVEAPHRGPRRVFRLDPLRLLDPLDLLVEGGEGHLRQRGTLQARAVYALEELVEHPEGLEFLRQARVRPGDALGLSLRISHGDRRSYKKTGAFGALFFG